MAVAKNKTRRHHSDELKQQILAECFRPGASVSSVALSHGLNANVVHKWHSDCVVADIVSLGFSRESRQALQTSPPAW